jgi:ribosomal protein L34E
MHSTNNASIPALATAQASAAASLPPARVLPSRLAHGQVYHARLAIDETVKKDAYRVRYRSYFTSGYIQSNSSGLFSDGYDDMPNSKTVVIYDGSHAVASVRVCVLNRDTNDTSPALDTYPEEVTRLLNADKFNAFGGRAIEVTRLVRSPEAENNQGLVFLLYRMAGYISLCAHTQTYLACVRTNHAPFYRRLGYDAASEPRPYPGLSCKMQLMASDRARYDGVRSKVPMMDPFTAATENLEGFFAGEPVTLRLTR